MDVGWQGRVDVVMEAHFVTEVGDVGLTGVHTLDDLKSLGQTEMGEMRFLSQGVDDKDIRFCSFGSSSSGRWFISVI